MAKSDSKSPGRNVKRFYDTQVMSGADAASYLEELARGLRQSDIAVGNGTQAITMGIHGDVELEVAARRGKRKGRIDLTLAFRAEDRGERENGTSGSGVAQPAETMPDEMSF
jgi:amphi-Trp domain-containing protein